MIDNNIKPAFLQTLQAHWVTTQKEPPLHYIIGWTGGKNIHSTAQFGCRGIARKMT